MNRTPTIPSTMNLTHRNRSRGMSIGSRSGLVLVSVVALGSVFSFPLAGHSGVQQMETPTIEATLGMHAGAQQDESAAIEATLHGYAKAVQSKDLEAVAALVTDDLLIFEGAHANRGWADYRDNHLGPELQQFEDFRYELSDIESEATLNLAWASFRYSMHVRIDDRTIDGGGAGTAILRRDGAGKWRIRHLHTSAARRG